MSMYFLVGACPEWPGWSFSVSSACAYPTRELTEWLAVRRGALVLGKGWTTTCVEEDVSHKDVGNGWVLAVLGDSRGGEQLSYLAEVYGVRLALLIEGCLQYRST